MSDTLTPTSWTIIVRKGSTGGNLIILKEEYTDYETVMARLSIVERNYGGRYWIDLRTHY
jgi:hypothetical protein